MANKRFSASIAEFGELTKRQMKDVLSASVEDVLKEARMPVARGGRMPTITAFLRSSLVGELNGTTSWPVTHPPKGGYDGGGDGDGLPPEVQLTVESMEPGDTARFAFTAAYAARLEYGFVGEDSLGRTFNQQGKFFVEGAAAQWQTIVAKNAARLK